MATKIQYRVTINDEVINNPHVSLESLAILVYLSSTPRNIHQIMTRFNLKMYQVEYYLKSLENKGYLSREVQDDN